MYVLRTLVSLVLSLFIAFPLTEARAMSSSNYAIPTDSIEGGGGDNAASANYKLNDSIGQITAGPGTSASFAAQQGYRVSGANPVLSVAFVDGSGNAIASPAIAFSGVTAGAAAASGTFGSSSARVRVTNTRTLAPWSMTIAATAGPSASWSNGTNTMSYDHPGSGSALTVDPTAGAIAPVNAPCTVNGIALGPAATFSQGTVDSITLLTAGAGADTQCAWDLTGAYLSQAIPSSQPAGAYSISMTITVS